MAKNKFRISESDFLLANRKASREEELERHGKQIIFRTTTQKSKKVYDRKRLKKADINHDDLLFFVNWVHTYVHMNTSILAPQRSEGASMRSGGRQREDRSLRGLDDAVKTE